MEGKYYNLWSTDNDRIDANDEVVIKSVYDPSPVGYSLPVSNAFTGFTITGGNTYNHSEFNVEGNYNNGWDFYTKPGKQGNTFFFPASGWRYNNIGAMSDVSTYGACYAAGQSSITSGMLLYFRSYYVQIGNDYRSGGFAVRSAEEKKWKYVCCRKLQMMFRLREVYDA